MEGIGGDTAANFNIGNKALPMLADRAHREGFLFFEQG